MKTFWTIIVLLIIVLGGWWLATRDVDISEPPTTTSPIKIGVIAALTGDGAEYGEPQRNALMMAVDDINDNGGINGQQLELIYEDGECTGEGGANAAQKLVNVDRVKIILGGSCSGETLAAIPVAELAKVFVFTGSATSPDLINKSPLFARDYPNDSTQGKVLAEAANQRGWKKVAVIQEQTDYALGIIKAFDARFKELGGTIIKEEFPSKTTDYRTALNKLRVAKPDALFVSVQTTAPGGRILKQVQELGWKPPLMINDVLGTSVEFVAENKTTLESALTADFFYDPSNPKFVAFNEAYKERYNKEIAFANYTSAVYDSLYIVKDAVQAVGYDGEKVAQWVRTLKDWEGVSGKVTIGADGERASGHVLKVVKNGKVELATQ